MPRQVRKCLRTKKNELIWEVDMSSAQPSIIFLEWLKWTKKNYNNKFKEEIKTVPVHFAGSIAFFCQDEIREVAEELGYKVGNFERRPIEGLVSFHTNKRN